MFNNPGSFALPILLNREKKGSPLEVIKIFGGHGARIFMGQGTIIYKRVGGKASFSSRVSLLFVEVLMTLWTGIR